ncbi:queuosine precursor transporter [Hyphobacterium marinum]|uniref:Probable queuosine precursor transporter n=1 Tax=Hyphobacterium marinum TaxID=3116574 RepID=A0ABU7LX19_9PROT|nr:queuosine precursor transporter [Hyphobacterium sp. Y6023]MEE2565817.1 queuosine precursor transporter [Hyphobacterium sp. Y6023]
MAPLNSGPENDGKLAESVYRPPDHSVVFIFSVSLFIACLIAGAVLAVKPIDVSVFGASVLVPVGTFAFALTFTATDVVSEVWGRRSALTLVFVGLAIRFLVLLLFVMGMAVDDRVPWVNQASIWSDENDRAFEFVLSGVNRANIAGMAAFGVSAVTDVLIYHFFKTRDLGKNRLWVRNNVSTIIAQIVNSMVFILVAFGGAVALASLASLIIGQVLFKAATAILDTPLVYLLRNIATRRKLLDFTG